MNKTRHPLHNRCRNELKVALKRFGTYQFDDKGAFEVMSIPSLMTEFYALPVEEAAGVFEAMYADKACDGRMQGVVSALLVEMQDWDELFDHPTIEKIDW